MANPIKNMFGRLKDGINYRLENLPEWAKKLIGVKSSIADPDAPVAPVNTPEIVKSDPEDAQRVIHEAVRVENSQYPKTEQLLKTVKRALKERKQANSQKNTLPSKTQENELPNNSPSRAPISENAPLPEQQSKAVEKESDPLSKQVEVKNTAQPKSAEVKNAPWDYEKFASLVPELHLKTRVYSDNPSIRDVQDNLSDLTYAHFKESTSLIGQVLDEAHADEVLRSTRIHENPGLRNLLNDIKNLEKIDIDEAERNIDVKLALRKEWLEQNMPKPGKHRSTSKQRH
jgi:hypothetical protein